MSKMSELSTDYPLHVHELAEAEANVGRLLHALKALVEEFGCTIEQYHKIGPHFTFKDGTEVFDVSVVLDRQALIERAVVAIAKAEKR